MRKIRTNKRHHPAKWWLELLPQDLRDPDIVRAKQLGQPSARRRTVRSAGH
jgi:hypothetical protein